MNLGKKIYELRTQKNLSQGELADALDVSRQSVSKWENNNSIPDLVKLIRMSEIYAVSLDELVGKERAASTQHKPEPDQGSTGITTADMVSILIFLFGVLIPIVILATAESHNSSLLLIFGLFVIPPLSTVCAALCSPKNSVLFWTYLVYDILFGILAVITGSVFAPFIAIFYIFAIGFWNDRRE